MSFLSFLLLFPIFLFHNIIDQLTLHITSEDKPYRLPVSALKCWVHTSNNLTTVKPLVWITSYWNKPLTRDGSSPYILQPSNSCRFPQDTHIWRSCLVRSTCIFLGIHAVLHLKLWEPNNHMSLSGSWCILSICCILKTHICEDLVSYGPRASF